MTGEDPTMKTVLVVEDNALNMRLASAILSSAGYSVLEASNAEDGLALARDRRPAAILMDIHLPGIDGIAALRMLRADPVIRETKVLLITASALTDDAERISAANFDGYVSKPFDIQALLNAVADALRE
jgi:two-component system, cell cycle response regulator DivK